MAVSYSAWQLVWGRRSNQVTALRLPAVFTLLSRVWPVRILPGHLEDQLTSVYVP